VLVWSDRRNARDELFFAKLRCGGDVPEIRSLGPVVDRHGTAPVPAPAGRCVLHEDGSYDVAAGAEPSHPRLIGRGGELWIGWDASSQASKPPEVLLRRFDSRARRFAPQQATGVFVDRSFAWAGDADRALLFGGDDSLALRTLRS